MGAVIARARADIAAGRVWKARDRLVGALVERSDDELLQLLGDVHFAMGDLPSAGAVWFASTRTGEDVDRARDAWRERHGRDAVQLWRSLPPSVRALENDAVTALRRDAAQEVAAGRRRGDVVQAPPAVRPFRLSGLGVAALVAAVCVLALSAVGAFTIISALRR